MSLNECITLYLQSIKERMNFLSIHENEYLERKAVFVSNELAEKHDILFKAMGSRFEDICSFFPDEYHMQIIDIDSDLGCHFISIDEFRKELIDTLSMLQRSQEFNYFSRC